MLRKRKIALILTTTIWAISSYSQPVNWNGRKSAVVLTYDDGLNVHLDNAIPILDSLALKATFYLSGYLPGCRNRIADWRKASTKGFELGNHSLFHPCIGNVSGREWVKPDYDMSKYTIQRMVDEIRMNNVFLEAVDGKSKRTFAYTCGDMKIGDSFFIDDIKKDFVAARSVSSGMLQPKDIDLYKVDCYAISGQSGQQMIDLVKQSMQTNSLLVFLFHGVGGEHSLNVSLDAHRQLLQFLKRNEKDVWIGTMVDVAEYIKKYQSQLK